MKLLNKKTGRFSDVSSIRLAVALIRSDEYLLVNDSEHWITMNGEHILINGEGKVIAGAGDKMNGKVLENVKSKSKDVEKHGAPVPQYPQKSSEVSKQTSEEKSHTQSLQNTTGEVKNNGESQRKFNSYIPQKSNAEAAKYAVDNNYVDEAIFGKLNVEISNHALSSLADHLNEFPELRPLQKAVGSIQERVAKNYDLSYKNLKERLTERYPEKSESAIEELTKKNCYKERVSQNTHAYSSPSKFYSGVFFNEKHSTKDLIALKNDLQKAEQSKWHPVGCNTIKSVFDHEYGHQLDDLLGLSKNSELIKMKINLGKENIGDGLSRYAAKNTQEFIAEAWAEYKNNPNPRPIAKKVAEIIKAEYDRKFPKSN